MVKQVIVSLICCALVAPLAFGKDTKKKRLHVATLSARPGVTVTAPPVITRVEEGEVAGFQPAGTVVIQQSGPGRFILDDASRVLNRRGEVVSGPLRRGTLVQVYFAETEGVKTIDHVVVY